MFLEYKFGIRPLIWVVNEELHERLLLFVGIFDWSKEREQIGEWTYFRFQILPFLFYSYDQKDGRFFLILFPAIWVYTQGLNGNQSSTIAVIPLGIFYQPAQNMEWKMTILGLLWIWPTDEEQSIYIVVIPLGYFSKSEGKGRSSWTFVSWLLIIRKFETNCLELFLLPIGYFAMNEQVFQ